MRLQRNSAYRNAHQAQGWKTDSACHAPHLPIFPFLQRDGEPAGCDVSTFTNGWSAWPKPFRFLYPFNFATLRNEISQVKRRTQARKYVSIRNAFDLSEVGFLLLVIGVTD